MFGVVQLFRSSESSTALPAISIIGDDTTIVGETIEGTGDLRIEGSVHADIVRDGRVVVAPQGAVHGTIEAESIHVGGTVRGTLRAETTLVLGASSDVEAHLEADALTIESGAAFKGDVQDVNGERTMSSEERSFVGDHGPVLSPTHLPAPEEENGFELMAGNGVPTGRH